jgi:replicative DNA helicase
MMYSSDRPLPHNIEFEKYVVACLLNMSDEPERLRACASLLRKEDFHNTSCLEIVKVILGLLVQGRAADLMGVCGVLDSRFEHSALEIAGEFVTDVHLESRIGELKRLSAARESIKLSEKFLVDAYDSEDFLSEIRSYGEKLLELYSGAEGSGAKVLDAADVKFAMSKKGVSSGFVTHDYNVCGFEPGRVTFLVGYRGDGKSTFIRQSVLACAMQRIPVFPFIGESSVEDEKEALACLCAGPGEIHHSVTAAGKDMYTPSEKAEKRFNELFSGLIYMCDTNVTKNQAQLFDVLLEAMRKHAVEYGVKLFVLDNMMVMNKKTGNAKFDEQNRITEACIKFAADYDVHVVIVAHPAKGQTGVSGVMEQENRVDNILRYFRFRAGDAKKKNAMLANTDLPEDLYDKITAVVLNEKARKRGSTQIPMFLMFDGMRGAVIEVTTLSKGSEYEEAGYWVKSVLPAGSASMEEAENSRSAYRD